MGNCLFLPDYEPFGPVRLPWRAPRRRLTLVGPAILGLGLGLVLQLG